MDYLQSVAVCFYWQNSQIEYIFFNNQKQVSYFGFIWPTFINGTVC